MTTRRLERLCAVQLAANTSTDVYTVPANCKTTIRFAAATLLTGTRPVDWALYFLPVAGTPIHYLSYDTIASPAWHNQRWYDVPLYEGDVLRARTFASSHTIDLVVAGIELISP